MQKSYLSSKTLVQLVKVESPPVEVEPQSVEVLLRTGRGPVEDGSRSCRGRVEVLSRTGRGPVEDRSRSCQGPVEVLLRTGQGVVKV